MKLKKFNQFIKEDLTPEELDELELQDQVDQEGEYDSVEDFKKELGEKDLGEDDYDLSDEDDELFEEEPKEGEDFDEETSEEESEEEGHEYKGTILMQELADKLGVEVVDNQISYGDKVINYYSETEKFHIDKEKFDTVEEVLEYLMPQDVEESSPEVSEEESVVGESRKYIKRF